MNFTKVKQTIEIPLLLVALIGGVYGGYAFLMNRVDEKLNDEKHIRAISKRIANDNDFLGTISKKVRSSFLIFDQNEIITYDHGAKAQIDSIKIHSINPTHLTKIIIYFNKYFQNAPFLQSLGPDIYDFTPRRSTGNIWILDLETPAFGGATTNKFRLELLP